MFFNTTNNEKFEHNSLTEYNKYLKSLDNDDLKNYILALSLNIASINENLDRYSYRWGCKNWFEITDGMINPFLNQESNKLKKLVGNLRYAEIEFRDRELKF